MFNFSHSFYTYLSYSFRFILFHANQSFIYCNGLTKIEIPSSIKEISTACFNDSVNLKEIRIHKKRGEVEGDPWGCIYGDKAIIWDE